MKIVTGMFLAIMACLTAAADTIKGVVTFSGAEFLVVASVEKPNRRGTLVRRITDGREAMGLERFKVGDVVSASGHWVRKEQPNAEFSAAQIMKIGEIGKMPPIEKTRNSSVRNGLKSLCRVTLQGEVYSSTVEEGDGTGGEETHLVLVNGNNRFAVCVHERLEEDVAPMGAWIVASGVAINVFSEDGKVLGAELEVTDSSGISLARGNITRTLLFVATFVASALAITALALLVAYLRTRRRRQILEVLAKERSRIAADLHDSLEQHLAGAKIRISAAVMALEKNPAKTREFLKGAAEVLAMAKTEVRDAVMNLRVDMESEATLSDELRLMASRISESGAARVRTALSSLPSSLSASVRFDLVSIVREATTNAVKHGKAKNIALVADKTPGGFSLKILNDGEAFDPETALGPEAGHYGLDSMRMRAARSGLKLTFVKTGRWCGFQVEGKS